MEIAEKLGSIVKDISKEYSILGYAYNKDFVAGQTPVYYSGPYWGHEELVAAMEALLTGKWLSAGEKVKEFEKKFAQAINDKFGVMVNSGSSANLVMMAALKAFFKWEDGDEIIVSAVGFPTTISVIYQNRLTPIFVDIELKDLNFDVNLIEAKITSKTRAVFLSPVLGNPPDIDELLRICDKYGIELVLDSCDSLGSKWQNKYLNEYAIASSHSFYPAHTITTGEGGMITTSNREIANLCKSFSSWGRACICSGSENLLPNGICNHRFDTWIDGYDVVIDHKYVFNQMGYNLKPLDLQGAIGLIQLEKLPEILEKRKESKQRIGDIFEFFLGDLLEVPKENIKADTAWFATPIICKNKETKHKLVSYLETNKIQTRNYFAGNILRHTGYKMLGDYRDYPISNQVLDLVFFVGAAPHYNDAVFNYISEVVKKYER